MKDDRQISKNKVIPILPAEVNAPLRLILQNQAGEVLLVRYQAGPDECKPVKPGSHAAVDGISYWSFKGLPHVRLIGNEASVAEAIVRTADRQLGIMIKDIEYIHLYDRRSGSPKFHRTYIWVREWFGQLPEYIVNPDSLPGDEGFHEWVPAPFLGSYLSHPELLWVYEQWRTMQKSKV